MRPSLSRVRTGLIPCVWSVCEGEGGVCVCGREEGSVWSVCGVCVRGRGGSGREFACVECVCVRYYSEYMHTFSEKPCSS